MDRHLSQNDGRPGRLSKAEVSSPRNAGHGRNWAVAWTEGLGGEVRRRIPT